MDNRFPIVDAISIHAPLTGSDLPTRQPGGSKLISIHAPLPGSDVLQNHWVYRNPDFNPRSPYGERRVLGYNANQND